MDDVRYRRLLLLILKAPIPRTVWQSFNGCCHITTMYAPSMRYHTRLWDGGKGARAKDKISHMFNGCRCQFTTLKRLSYGPSMPEEGAMSQHERPQKTGFMLYTNLPKDRVIPSVTDQGQSVCLRRVRNPRLMQQDAEVHIETWVQLDRTSVWEIR